MSLTELQQPILADGVRSVNFFNGRLLSAEDLRRERDAARAALRRLGQALAPGVVAGLMVTPRRDLAAPVVTVEPGLALSRGGQILELAQPVDLALGAPTVAAGGGPVGFAACGAVEPGTFVFDAGIYLLVLAPAAGSEGRAPVSGLGNAGAPCNVRYLVEGVQFRLIGVRPQDDLDLEPGELSDAPRLRNRLAFACSGLVPAPTWRARPLEPIPATPDPLARLRVQRLSDCDVPLALIRYTPDDGVIFADSWAVRRRPALWAGAGPWEGDGERGRWAAPGVWAQALGDTRQAAAEAMLLQFQAQLNAILDEPAVSPKALSAATRLAYLPGAGYLPVGATGFDWQTFLGPLAPPALTPVDGSLLREVVLRGLLDDPVPLATSGGAAGRPAPALAVLGEPGGDVVAFARARAGRVRVTFSPAPGPGLTLQVRVRRADAEAGVLALPATGSPRSADVPPGRYLVQATAAGFASAEAEVEAIGGRTTEIALELPPGSLRLEVRDAAGNPIAASVNATASPEGAAGPARSAAPAGGGALLFAGMAPGSYLVAVSASGFRPHKSGGIVVEVGARTELQVTLVAEQTLLPPPDERCVILSTGTSAYTASRSRMRLCLVLEAGLPVDAIERGQKLDLRALVSPTEGLWLPLSQSLTGAPRKALMNWLNAWQGWLEQQGLVGSAGSPEVYISREYQAPAPGGVSPGRSLTSPVKRQRPPATPQAYAVFGDYAVPLLINPDALLTVEAVPIAEALAGLTSPRPDEGLLRLLASQLEFTAVDQLAGAWSQLLVDKVGLKAAEAERLIEAAVAAIYDAGGR